MSPLFTVIIPTHNRSDRLATAIRSVHQQIYTNWEIIVVDDGSDPPVELLPDALDERVHLCRQANAGPAAARRLGIGHARGDIVCFLDDDDFFLPDHLYVLQMAYVQQPGLYAVGLLAQTTTGSQVHVPLYPNQHITLNDYWSRPVGLFPFGIPIGMLRTICLVDAPAIEDFAWIVQLLASEKAYQLPNYTAVFVTHLDNRTTTQLNRQDLLARERVIQNAYMQPAVRAQITHVAYRRRLTHQRLHWTRQCLRAGQWRDALYGCWRGIRGMHLENSKELAYTLLTAWRAYRSR